MISMTGFGRARGLTPQGSVEVTLSCINKRGLEMFVTLPRELNQMEGAINELLKKSFERGKLQFTLRFEASRKKSAGDLETRFKSLKKACQSLKVPFEPDAELVADLLRGESTSAPIDFSKMEKPILAATVKAIQLCQATQLTEGKSLSKDFSSRIKSLRGLHTQAGTLAPLALPRQRERLLKNLQQSNLSLDPSDERVLKEIALFSDRVDICEELTRISTHLDSLTKLIAAEGSIGRQIEFLLQELLREWNTLGNKSVIVELVQVALAAKNEIERLREQAANIA